MLKLDDFLRRGFFPKELLPPFTTISFADALEGLGAVPEVTYQTSKCVRFSFSKYASLRRDISIPNPHPFCELAGLIVEHWDTLTAQWAKSSITRSAPVLSTVRAVEGASGFTNLPSTRAEVRSSGRFLLNADVSKFYHTIYTHSLPWALHGKANAKNNRRWSPKTGMPQLVGNGLDLWSRNLQDGQTIGLPVGPDTSFVLAEALLSAVDQLLMKEITDARGFRFVDDYEFVCDSLEKAEQILAVLQGALSEFELNLNPKKTTTTELPAALDTTWVNEFSGLEFAAEPQKMQRQLVRYFTDAFELARKFPGEPVLKYITARLPSDPPDNNTAILIQRLSLQAACVDSGTLQQTLLSFQEHRTRGKDIDLPALKRALDFITQRHAPLGHSSEVAWCIWAAGVFAIQLSKESAACIEEMKDDAVALTALDGIHKKVFESPPNINVWADLIKNFGLNEQHWLLVYESIGQGWLPSPGGNDPALEHQFFQHLRAKDVKFYDSTVNLNIPVPPIPNIY
ncbi:RNA-directed DNA polymerase [Desulfatibacillum aliphaticivorans]|uniref:RNA-directed DNA polymerase n=1 Tax=Desulfatibacillum aliphaticivorans TaxID=218208 RepID=UPI00040E45DC|nr:RNA-directed DNA polymerase [Desulfatibacillum aliphaticivorans]